MKTTSGSKVKFVYMGNFLYVIAIFLIIIWAVGFFAMDAGSTIHALLIVAAITIILRLVSRKNIL